MSSQIFELFVERRYTSTLSHQWYHWFSRKNCRKNNDVSIFFKFCESMLWTIPDRLSQTHTCKLLLILSIFRDRNFHRIRKKYFQSKIVETIATPNLSMWGCSMSGCRSHDIAQRGCLDGPYQNSISSSYQFLVAVWGLLRNQHNEVTIPSKRLIFAKLSC